MINLYDKKGRPPIGAIVYVKRKHAIGTVVGLDGGMAILIQFPFSEPEWFRAKDVQVIGPEELVKQCVDVCPICEECIYVKKKER